MDEEDRVVQLLASLHESYDTPVKALGANEKIPYIETVIELLLYEKKLKLVRDRQKSRENCWLLEVRWSGNEEYAVTTVKNLEYSEGLLWTWWKEEWEVKEVSTAE